MAGVRAEAVSERYGEGEAWVLRHLDLEIAPGQSVAITGPSGCGKTTLLKVLMGLLVPTEGRVLLDEHDLRAAAGGAVRDGMAGVLQDDGLFAGSIAENVGGFDAQLDHGWLEECAARAAILGDIRRMPMGFESLVGDMGSTLSGGQKQRVILARALYRRPRILFLDEATEAAIAAALRDLRMTRVIVAHRPATIAHANRVIPFAELGIRPVRPCITPARGEQELRLPGRVQPEPRPRP